MHRVARATVAAVLLGLCATFGPASPQEAKPPRRTEVRGEAPRMHVLRARAIDAGGEPLADVTWTARARLADAGRQLTAQGGGAPLPQADRSARSDAAGRVELSVPAAAGFSIGVEAARAGSVCRTWRFEPLEDGGVTDLGDVVLRDAGKTWLRVRLRGSETILRAPDPVELVVPRQRDVTIDLRAVFPATCVLEVRRDGAPLAAARVRLDRLPASGARPVLPRTDAHGSARVRLARGGSWSAAIRARGCDGPQEVGAPIEANDALVERRIDLDSVAGRLGILDPNGHPLRRAPILLRLRDARIPTQIEAWTDGEGILKLEGPPATLAVRARPSTPGSAAAADVPVDWGVSGPVPATARVDSGP